MKRKHKKSYYYIILLLVVVGLSVGNALLQTTLTINGTSKIKGNTWDIHFANLQVTDGSVSIGTGDVAASIQSSNTDITYTVTLNTPGDFYEFTVDAVNAGTIDGMVESVTSKLNNQPITTLPNYLNYSVTYETGDDIELNHLLKAGESETYKVRIEFKRDIENTDLPSMVQTLSFNFGVVYVQSDNNGVEVVHPLNGIVYTVNHILTDGEIALDQEFPSTISYYETPEEALSALAAASGQNLPFYLKHKVENGIVTESYVEVVVTEALAQANNGMGVGTYSFGGGTNTIISYESIKELMNTIFGYSTDSSRCSEVGSYYSCGVVGLQARGYSSGFLNIHTDSTNACGIYTNGASCYWE